MVQADVHGGRRRGVFTLQLLVGRPVLVHHAHVPTRVALKVVADQLADPRHDVRGERGVGVDHRRLFVQPNPRDAVELVLHDPHRGLGDHGSGIDATCAFKFVGELAGVAKRHRAIRLVARGEGLRDLERGVGHGAERFLVHQQPVCNAGAQELDAVGRHHARLLRRDRAQLQVLVGAKARVKDARLPTHLPVLTRLRERHLAVVVELAAAGKLPVHGVVGRGEVFRLAHAGYPGVERLGLEAVPILVDGGGGCRGVVDKRIELPHLAGRDRFEHLLRHGLRIVGARGACGERGGKYSRAREQGEESLHGIKIAAPGTRPTLPRSQHASV